MAMQVDVTYYVSFGPGDGSEIMDYEITLSDEEEKAYLEAKKLHVPFEDYPILQAALDSAKGEIADIELENFIEAEDEYAMECSGRVEVDIEDITKLIEDRDPYTLDFFNLTGKSDEEIEEFVEEDLEYELPMVYEFDEDFEETSPFEAGWDLVVEFAEDPEDYDEEDEE